MIALSKPDLTQEETRHIWLAMQSGYVTHRGEYEGKFERLFSKTVSRPALATSSGTGALHIALLSLGVGRGDEVVLPTLTFGATAAVVVQVGAKPVFVDVTDNYCMDWYKACEVMNRKTKAIIPVHLYGERCEFDSRCGIPIVEDSCEALGYVEPTADFAAYSFYGNKVITTGEGGMLVGNIENSRKWRDGGFNADYEMVCAGLNYRMSNISAAIGYAQLTRLNEILDKRKKCLDVYNEHLKGRGKWLFVVDCENPRSLAEHLKKHGVETRPVFKPLHLTEAFKSPKVFPVAERLWSRGLCIPTGSHVSPNEAKQICKLITDHERPEHRIAA